MAKNIGEAYELVVGALEEIGSLRIGSQDFQCPAHEDGNASLGIKEGHTQVLINCQAGCSAREVVEALGLKWRDVRVPLNRTATGKRKKSAAANLGKLIGSQVFTYTDEHGVPMVNVYRHDHEHGKVLRQGPGSSRKPGPVGVAFADRPLYHLPALLEAPAGSRVWIVEGETSVHALESVGEVATTQLMGGKQPWNDADTPHFKGLDVYIVADRDLTGYKRARTVARALQIAHVAKSVTVVRSSCEFKGADIVDHIAGLRPMWDVKPIGGNPWKPGLEKLDDAQLDKLAATEDATGYEDGPNNAPVKRSIFRCFSGADLAAPVPPLEWLVRGIWPKGSYGVLAGPKKALKSYMALCLAVSVASGEAFLSEFEVPHARAVLYISGEGGPQLAQRRLQEIAKCAGVDLHNLTNLTVADGAASLESDEFKGEMATILSESDPALVILDPLYTFHPPGIDPSNVYERGPMLTQLRELFTGRAFVIVDHFNKTGSTKLDLDSIAQAGMGQWADSWILVNHAAEPDLNSGTFHLNLSIGSRQWGGIERRIEFETGAFDPRTGEHFGDVSWSVIDLSSLKIAPASLDDLILEVVDSHTDGVTLSNIVKSKLGKSETTIRNCVQTMLDEGRLEKVEDRQPDSTGRIRPVGIVRRPRSEEGKNAADPDPTGEGAER